MKTAPEVRPDVAAVSPSVSRRWAWVLIASTAWTYWVWITRVINIARQPQTTGFKVVHYVLAAGSIGFGTAIGALGVRLLRASKPR